MKQLIVVADNTSTGTFTADELFNTAWALAYQARYHYNRSPWVAHGYSEAIEVHLLPHGAKVPAGAWCCELLDTSDQEGALGYHEDQARTSTAHSTRGLAAGTETPLAKVFCATSKEAGVEPSEVASHEILEMAVDPYVVDESRIRVYPGPEGKEYIAEVGDPVQGEGYDVGAPESRITGVIVANFAYPAWWSQPQHRLGFEPQHRLGFDFRHIRTAAFQLAPGGYQSVRSPGGEWESIYGASAGKDRT